MTGIFVASALVVALALLALVVHRRGRRARATGPEAPGASLVTTPGDSPTYAVGPGPDDLVLVPFPNDIGQALVVVRKTRSRSSTRAASRNATRAQAPARYRSSFAMRWRPAA